MPCLTSELHLHILIRELVRLHINVHRFPSRKWLFTPICRFKMRYKSLGKLRSTGSSCQNKVGVIGSYKAEFHIKSIDHFLMKILVQTGRPQRQIGFWRVSHNLLHSVLAQNNTYFSLHSVLNLQLALSSHFAFYVSLDTALIIEDYFLLISLTF